MSHGRSYEAGGYHPVMVGEVRLSFSLVLLVLPAPFASVVIASSRSAWASELILPAAEPGQMGRGRGGRGGVDTDKVAAPSRGKRAG